MSRCAFLTVVAVVVAVPSSVFCHVQHGTRPFGVSERESPDILINIWSIYLFAPRSPCSYAPAEVGRTHGGRS